MLLFNKSNRVYQLTTGELKPKENLEVNQEEGEKLLKMYPHDLIKASDIREDKTIKALEEENATLKKQIIELKANKKLK